MPGVGRDDATGGGPLPVVSELLTASFASIRCSLRCVHCPALPCPASLPFVSPQPEHEAFKALLAAPQDEARTIARRRFPVPRIVDCDQNGSQVGPALRS